MMRAEILWVFFWFEVLFQVCTPIAAVDNSHAANRLQVFERMFSVAIFVVCVVIAH